MKAIKNGKIVIIGAGHVAVSYTHLDVYKRQGLYIRSKHWYYQ